MNISKLMDNQCYQLKYFRVINGYNIPLQLKIFINKNDTLIEKTIDLSINPVTLNYDVHQLNINSNQEEKIWIEITNYQSIDENEKIAYQLIIN